MPRYVKGLYDNTGTFIAAIGNSTPSFSSLYIAPTSTSFSGANDYYFTYLATPTTSGSTTGAASTLYIAGAPSGATTAYALNVAAGNTYLGGTLNVAGASTVAAVSASGIISTSNTTSASSTTTGALKSAGGLGVVENAYIGGTLNVAGTSTVAAISASGTISTSKTGNTIAASASLYIAPASTALSGSNNYFFTYLATPTTSGSTSGTASTLYIQGAPVNASTSYALNVADGNTYLGGALNVTGTSTLAAVSANTVNATTFQVTTNGGPTAVYGNSTNTQTGMYFDTATTCSMICDGSTKMRFGTSANTSYQPIYGTDGTALAPSYTFTTVQNAGLYYAGANKVGISSAGGQVAGFETGGMKLYSSITGYTPSLMGVYHEATVGCTMTNGNNSQNLSLLFTRVGRLCHIRIPYFTTTNTNGSATLPNISFNVAPINTLYNYSTPGGNGAYFSLGVGYVASTRVYLITQLNGTTIYFYNQTALTVPNGWQYEHLGSTITYIFT